MSATAACLPCPVCAHSGVFESVESLRDRLIYVSTNKMFCPVCQEEISGLDKLTIHLFSHVKMLSNKIYSEKTDAVKNNNKTENQSASSLQEKQAKCVVAKNKSASSTAVAPMKYVKIYPKLPTISLKAIPIVEVSNSHVDNCGQSISTVAFKAETIINSTNNICDICGLQFVDSDILRMHKGLIHNIDEISNNNFSRYECHLCPKYFKMRGSLMVHLRVAHFGFLSGNCGSEYTNDGQEKKMTNDGSGDQYITLQRNDNKQWQCDVCRKCFTTKYFLKKHKRLHTGETPYACSQCNKTFTFQQSYHKHLLYHNDEKPHTCSYCGRAFKELSTLHNHQRIHTGEKPFSCETCGKCFRQRVSYLVHRRIHTGVMPYKCTACEKSFRYKVSQRTHKCLAKPPGTVVRQSGNLVEKLKKKNKVPDIDNEDNKPEASFVEVSEANAELVRTGAKLSLEDMESENFTLLAENLVNTGGNSEDFRSKPCSSKVFNATQVIHNKVSAIDSNLDELIESIPCIDKNMPSPSEILKNLCLSKDDDYMAILQNQENEKQFDLYSDLGALL